MFFFFLFTIHRSSVPDVTKPPKVKRKRKWWQLGRRNRREEDVSNGRNHVGSSNVDPVTSQVDPGSPNQTEDTTGSTPQGVREGEPTTPTPTQQTTPPTRHHRVLLFLLHLQHRLITSDHLHPKVQTPFLSLSLCKTVLIITFSHES